MFVLFIIFLPILLLLVLINFNARKSKKLIKKFNLNKKAVDEACSLSNYNIGSSHLYGNH